MASMKDSPARRGFFSPDLDALKVERDENEIRKSFTVTERLAIAQRIAERLCPDGSRQGQRTDLGENLPMSEEDSGPFVPIVPFFSGCTESGTDGCTNDGDEMQEADEWL